MKQNKIAVFICAALIFMLMLVPGIKEYYEDKDFEQESEQVYETEVSEGYIALFVTERNEVLKLYEALELLIEQPTDENYKEAYETAVQTERVCRQTAGENDNVYGYPLALVYYTTFYRDIKAGLDRQCEVSDVEKIKILLGRILELYDKHTNQVIGSKKAVEICEFYDAIHLLHYELQICNTILSD